MRRPAVALASGALSVLVAACASGGGGTIPGSTRDGATSNRPDAAGTDAGSAGGFDAGGSTGFDAGVVVGTDAGGVVGTDAGSTTPDAGFDAGPPPPGCAMITCDPVATCAEVMGRGVCSCPAGYDDPRADGTLCNDIDECMRGTAGCSPLATCANTPGSVTCTCTPGYAGDGRTCADIDECMMGTAGCSPFATCMNTPGSATCTCMSGYTGDGRTCTMTIRRVLVFDDTGGSQADEAATQLGMMPVVTADGPSFAAQYDAGGLALVIIDSGFNVVPFEVSSRVQAWVAAGNRLVYAYWDLDTDPATQASLGVACASYHATRSVFRDASTADFFGLRETLPSPQFGTDTLDDDGDTLVLTAGGFVAARVDSASGPTAIAVTRTNRVIVNGFQPFEFTNDADFDGRPDMRELYVNELVYLGF